MADNKTILLVDDDKDFIDIYTVILEKEGYTIKSALSGSEGLAIAKNEKPDLIILDIMMEDADSGFEFAQDLKDDGIEIPIILSSSIANASSALFNTSELNVRSIVQKPIDREYLISLVKKYS